ncbi:hypothetical protein L6164_014839 [Bauhinia variegata]|uniref:Uncharacterized protein n=1 Tax=Bauhinia variegata TaxID=167791 RepID=A0ACB9NK25_BAUVA|nr:hypothetical protein L6164_014839 [Bauhinia variegata]
MMQHLAEDRKEKRAKTNCEKKKEEDLIHQLPDGIPVAILSKLPIDEAVRTSILSSKWRYFWTSFSGTLEFDGSPTMKDMRKDIQKRAISSRGLQMAMDIIYNSERIRYINWINELLNSLKSPNIEGFKIWFDVGTDGSNDVDNWVQFAIQKEVQKLELFCGSSYVMPLHLFKLAKFNSLRVFRVRSITVTEEMLEYLLCCCPNLEVISLNSSLVPASMKISGKSLQLKRLDLISCLNLETIEISAANLMSIAYHGLCLDMTFESAPNLMEASFGGGYAEFCGESFLSQLRVLKLNITENAPQVIYELHQLPELTNLKHLELTAYVDDGISLNICVLLLKASPSLCKLTLKMLNAEPIFRTVGKFTMENQYKLKELELIGFCGAACEVEFLVYILENAVELDKITIDPKLEIDPEWVEGAAHSLVQHETWDHGRNRMRARGLRNKIPPWVEFVCL